MPFTNNYVRYRRNIYLFDLRDRSIGGVLTYIDVLRDLVQKFFDLEQLNKVELREYNSDEPLSSPNSLSYLEDVQIDT